MKEGRRPYTRPYSCGFFRRDAGNAPAVKLRQLAWAKTCLRKTDAWKNWDRFMWKNSGAIVYAGSSKAVETGGVQLARL